MFRRVVLALVVVAVGGCRHDIADYAGTYVGDNAQATVDATGKCVFTISGFGGGEPFQLSPDGHASLAGIMQDALIKQESQDRADVLSLGDATGQFQKQVDKDVEAEKAAVNAYAQVGGDRMKIDLANGQVYNLSRGGK